MTGFCYFSHSLSLSLLSAIQISNDMFQKYLTFFIEPKRICMSSVQMIVSNVFQYMLATFSLQDVFYFYQEMLNRSPLFKQSCSISIIVVPRFELEAARLKQQTCAVCAYRGENLSFSLNVLCFTAVLDLRFYRLISFFKMGPFPASYFIFVLSIAQLVDKILPMFEFEPWISGVVSDRSTN